MQVVTVASLAFWALMDGVGNLVGYELWVKVVAFVMALEELMVNGEPHPRAILNPVLPHIAYAFIYVSKFSGGILCVMSGIQMWKLRHEVEEVYNAAKEKFFVGAGIIVFMLTFGFISMKGGLFNTGQMPSEFTLQVFDFVTMYLAMCGASILYVALPTQPK